MRASAADRWFLRRDRAILCRHVQPTGDGAARRLDSYWSRLTSMPCLEPGVATRVQAQTAAPKPAMATTKASGLGVPSAKAPSRPEPAIPAPYCKRPDQSGNGARPLRKRRHRAGDRIGDDEAIGGDEHEQRRRQTDEAAGAGPGVDGRPHPADAPPGSRPSAESARCRSAPPAGRCTCSSP